MQAHRKLMAFFKAIAKIVLAFAFVVAAFFAYDRFNSQSLRTFCGSLSTGSTPESVLTAAKEKLFVTHDLIERLGLVSVLNHRSPFFRYECSVSFRNGQMTGAQLRAAD